MLPNKYRFNENNFLYRENNKVYLDLNKCKYSEDYIKILIIISLKIMKINAFYIKEGNKNIKYDIELYDYIDPFNSKRNSNQIIDLVSINNATGEITTDFLKIKKNEIDTEITTPFITYDKTEISYLHHALIKSSLDKKNTKGMVLQMSKMLNFDFNESFIRTNKKIIINKPEKKAKVKKNSEFSNMINSFLPIRNKIVISPVDNEISIPFFLQEILSTKSNKLNLDFEEFSNLSVVMTEEEIICNF